MTSGGTQRSIGSRALLAATSLAALTLLVSVAAPERASAANCANAEATIDQASAKELGKALACLINGKRSKRDRHKLDTNGKLEKAAKRHNRTMLDQDLLGSQVQRRGRAGEADPQDGLPEGRPQSGGSPRTSAVP